MKIVRYPRCSPGPGGAGPGGSGPPEAVSGAPARPAVGVGAHSDSGFLTLLLQDSAGLEVWHEATAEWRFVEVWNAREAMTDYPPSAVAVVPRGSERGQ